MALPTTPMMAGKPRIEDGIAPQVESGKPSRPLAIAPQVKCGLAPSRKYEAGTAPMVIPQGWAWHEC
jgi:hypothetical protein